MQGALAILCFELRRHLRRPSFWVVAGLLFAFGLIDAISNARQGDAYFYVNSPSRIFFTTQWYCFFALLATTSCIADAFVRDAALRTEETLLATPIGKGRYLGLRFVAAFAAALLAFSCYLPGMVLANFVPGQNPYAVGPLRVDAYLASYVMIAAPNVLAACVITFAMASRTRSLTACYVAAIGLMALYFAALMLVGIDSIDYEQLRVWALADPYGFYATESETLFWSIHQRNTQAVPISGVLLANRLLWLAIMAVVWGASFRGFRLRRGVFGYVSRRRLAHDEPRPVEPAPISQASSSNRVGWSTFLRTARFALSTVLKGRAFWLLSSFGVVNAVLACLGRRTYADTNPSTDILIHASNVSLQYILFAIVLVYTAELVWRDRAVGVQPVVDATPAPSSALLLGRFAALVVVVVVYLTLIMATLLACQTLLGHTDYDFPLYLKMLFGEHGPYYVFAAALGLFAQAITRSKYIGMGVVVAAAMSVVPLNALGLYHNLYRWGQTNDIEYSPMNGYGGLYTGHLWYTLYWGLFSAILLSIAAIAWPRGEPQRRDWRALWRGAGVGVRSALLLSSVAWVGVGAWVFYNTTVLNPFQPPGKEETTAQIEKRFKQYEQLPMPLVTKTQVNVELYPERGCFTAEGEYTLENRTGEPVEELHLLMFLHASLDQASCPGASLREAHPEWGYWIYDLAEPLGPGESTTLQFAVSTPENKGFCNHVDSDDVYMFYPNDVVDNGTNLYSPFFLPFVGYTKVVEHKKGWKRAKQDLPPLDSRMRAHDDPVGLSKGLMLSHLAWGPAEVTIGAPANQTTVCAGALVKEAQADGRAYRTYRLPQESRGRFTIYSGRYEVRRDERCRVPIEVYYHPRHDANVDLIVEELAGAFEFFEATFGEYPFDQVRLAECVYYDSMVMSDAGTLGIPEVLVWKSEASGAGRDRVVEWLAYLLAKSWFGESLMTSDTAGGMTVAESLAEYASQLYLRQGRSPVQQTRAQRLRFREFFRALGKADFKEPPLSDVYNELLVARRKGGLTLDLIESLIGQNSLVAAINRFREPRLFAGPPYATVIDLRDEIAAQSGRWAPFVREAFSRPLAFDVRVNEATFAPTGQGQYKVSASLHGVRLESQGLDRSKESPLGLPVKVEMRGRSGEVLVEDVVEFEQIDQPWEATVAAVPARIEVDPDLLLPSATTRDNQMRLRRVSPEAEARGAEGAINE